MMIVRYLWCFLTLFVLCAGSGCVVLPISGDGGEHEHGGDRSERGSKEHRNELRGPVHWNDAGDRSEHEESSLGAQPLQLGNARFLRAAIYVSSPAPPIAPSSWT